MSVKPESHHHTCPESTDHHCPGCCSCECCGDSRTHRPSYFSKDPSLNISGNMLSQTILSNDGSDVTTIEDIINEVRNQGVVSSSGGRGGGANYTRCVYLVAGILALASVITLSSAMAYFLYDDNMAVVDRDDLRPYVTMAAGAGGLVGWKYYLYLAKKYCSDHRLDWGGDMPPPSRPEWTGPRRT